MLDLPGRLPGPAWQHGLCDFMILDIARLVLFPALMAFAAASDLFTMTISNRVSLALVAGFLARSRCWAAWACTTSSLHLGAGAAGPGRSAFACFAMGWVGGGDAKVAACVRRSGSVSTTSSII